MKNDRISIIGFGNFGKLAAKHLSKKAEVIVTDVSDKTKEADEMGVRFVSLDEACKSKIVIIAVPMENFESTLLRIKDKLQEGTLVLDVCSLKMFSCDLMRNIIGNKCEIIGTHPLFGPQSAPGSIIGMRIAICNINARDETLRKVVDFCSNLGLNVIETTPEEHDRQMAVSQALTHFIGQVCKKMNIKRVELSTKTFDDLVNIVNIVGNDTPALFDNMQKMNPFAIQARNRFVVEARKINKELDNEGSNM
jgi:prephenate dehydrogenase